MSDATVLVVGGAGYIGSHTCLRLAEKGFKPVVFDNFCNGHTDFVKWGPAERGDIRDRKSIDQVIEKYQPVAILHFAGLIEVGLSVRDPLTFYDNNVIGSLNLIAAADNAGIKSIVFSSTCATYGLPQKLPLDETHPQEPINPYGRTKLVIEQALADIARYRDLRYVALRYFNAAGADPLCRIGERHNPETHAIPLAIDAALGRREAFKVFGTDYPTKDGTCVRDYVHVLDLADAHVAGVEHLVAGNESLAVNLGTGSGTSVNELIKAIERVSAMPVPVIYADRREGDSTTLFADNRLAKEKLNWEPKYGLDEIVETAWRWHSQSNRG